MKNKLKNILQIKPLLFAVNILLTCISLIISLLFAEALCDATVEAFRDSRFAGYLNTITPKMFLFVFLLFFFDGFFGILRSHHAAERTVFLQNTKHEVGVVSETVKIILSADFWVEAAIFAISCYFSERFGLIHFVLLSAICAFRKALVRRKWYVTRKKLPPKNTFLSVLKNIIFLMGQIFLFIYIIPISFPYLWILITQYKAISRFVFAVLTVCFICIYGNAVKKRNGFIKKLRLLCEEKGFELSEIKGRYSFIFGRKAGASFSVTAHGKKYVCKFIGSKVKGVPMVFTQGGDGGFRYTFKIGAARLLNKTSYFEYGFDAEENAQKILICSPLPNKMSIEENGSSLQISSGAYVWEYKVFGASNFLRCLEWNVIEK